MAETTLKLFGFELRRAKKTEVAQSKLKSIVPPVDEDGAGYVTAAGAHYGQYIDIDGDKSKDNYQMIQKYRGTALHPEVDAAIEDIMNESISGSEEGFAVKLEMESLKASNGIQKKIQTEFDDILKMLHFTDLGHDIFRRWYIDGRLAFHLVANVDNPAKGIEDIRPIDSAKIRKIKEVKTSKDPVTGAKIIENTDEYYIYQEKPGQQQSGVKLTKDSVLYVTSGLLDETQKKIISYLHKALKPLNQLRMMEDSLVIYRLARAPERRIFYIDVGNLPKGKSEEYMKGIMAKYRNKLVYDASTGAIKDDRKHMSMLEDFWLPRREGGRGTEISTLPGGDNLGQIDDIIYFQKRLYKSLNVPIGRLESESQFSLGRSTEISRDELKFQKFIDRLRKRFSILFAEILKRQLILKGVITEQDWDEWGSDVHFDYVRDNHFTELKDAELLRERLQTLDLTQQYIGEYFSKEYVFRNVLMLGDEEIKEMKKQIADEEKSGEIPDDEAKAAEAEAQNAPAAPTPVQIVKPEKEEDNG
jgi:hypothetical protein